jgi:hypothetical protein
MQGNNHMWLATDFCNQSLKEFMTDLELIYKNVAKPLVANVTDLMIELIFWVSILITI